MALCAVPQPDTWGGGRGEHEMVVAGGIKAPHSADAYLPHCDIRAGDRWQNQKVMSLLTGKHYSGADFPRASQSRTEFKAGAPASSFPFIPGELCALFANDPAALFAAVLPPCVSRNAVAPWVSARCGLRQVVVFISLAGRSLRCRRVWFSHMWSSHGQHRAKISGLGLLMEAFLTCRCHRKLFCHHDACGCHRKLFWHHNAFRFCRKLLWALSSSLALG